MNDNHLYVETLAAILTRLALEVKGTPRHERAYRMALADVAHAMAIKSETRYVAPSRVV